MTSSGPHEFVPALMGSLCDYEWTDPDDLDDPVHVCALPREDHLPSLACQCGARMMMIDLAASEWACTCGLKFVTKLDTTPILNA